LDSRTIHVAKQHSQLNLLALLKALPLNLTLRLCIHLHSKTLAEASDTENTTSLA